MAECPACGKAALETRHGEYRFEPPDRIPGGIIAIPNASWEECTACGEQFLGPDLGAALSAAQYRRLGLLTPEEIREVRERAGLTQAQMAEFVGVGAKTYTRWESGRSMQNTSSDNLIRLAGSNPDLFVRLEAQRDPGRRDLVAQYIRSLASLEGEQRLAMAAHGAELDPDLGEVLRRRLQDILASRQRG